MRAAPFGWIPCDRSDLEHWIVPSALEVAGYTHGHITGQVSAAALALVIYELVHGAHIAEAVTASVTGIQNIPGSRETVEAITSATTQAQCSPRSIEALESLGGGWVAEEALGIAIYCSLSFPEPDQLLDALALAINHSGDSDSTGAICGNILGALHGQQALPTQLVDDLEGLATLRAMGDEFISTFTEHYERTN